MKASDASYLCYMHTGIDEWQKKILYNIYLKKIAWRLLIVWASATIMVVVTIIIGVALEVGSNFQILVPSQVGAILLTLTAFIVVFFIVDWSYFLKQDEIETELSDYYGAFPKVLEKIIIDNSDSLMNGETLPPEYYKAEQEILDNLTRPE